VTCKTLQADEYRNDSLWANALRMPDKGLLVAHVVDTVGFGLSVRCTLEG